MPDLASYRAEFPVLAGRTYLISASLGPLSRRARAAAEEHLALWARLGPDELWGTHALPRLAACRERFAALIGADAGEVAIVPSVSAGLSAIASCLDLSGHKVVLSDMDFPTDHYVWRAQEPAGVDLDVVSSRDGVTIDAAAVAERIDDSTAVVNVNRVLFESSALVDLGPIVAAARRHGALVVVDDFHGTGVVPLDVHAAGVDLLVSGALKWLCGGQGIAFLYCRAGLVGRLRPRVTGWLGTADPFDFDRTGLRLRPDAGRFETGTYPVPQAFTAVAGMDLILEVGVDRVRARSLELTRAVIERADNEELEILTPRADDARGGLVRVRVPGGAPAAQGAVRELLERNVVLDARGDALRISPHFFNTEEDIERCFDELRKVLQA